MSTETQIIIGYALTIITYIIYCSSRFMKNKTTMLLMDMSTKMINVVALYCLSSLTGSVNMFIAILVLIAASIKEKTNKKLAGLYTIFQIAYIISLVITFNGASSILMFTASSLCLLGNWWLSPQGIRKTGIAANICYLTYQILIKNYAGLLELITLACNISSLVKYRKLKADNNMKIAEVVNNSI
jgi:hypothetical protein